MTVAPMVAGPLAPALHVIWLLPWPAVMAPPLMVQAYAAPAVLGTEAVLPVEFAETEDAEGVIVASGEGVKLPKFQILEVLSRGSIATESPSVPLGALMSIEALLGLPETRETMTWMCSRCPRFGVKAAGRKVFGVAACAERRCFTVVLALTPESAIWVSRPVVGSRS